MINKTTKLSLAMAVLFLGGIAQADAISLEEVEKVTQYCKSHPEHCAALAEEVLAETELIEEEIMVSMTASEAELAEMGTSMPPAAFLIATGTHKLTFLVSVISVGAGFLAYFCKIREEANCPKKSEPS